jgi:hypothetical protein
MQLFVYIVQGVPLLTKPGISFNNSKTNEDIATRFEQEYVCCVRNEEECVCSVCLFRCNIFIGFRIIKEMPGLLGSGTPYVTRDTSSDQQTNQKALLTPVFIRSLNWIQGCVCVSRKIIAYCFIS